MVEEIVISFNRKKQLNLIYAVETIMDTAFKDCSYNYGYNSEVKFPVTNV